MPNKKIVSFEELKDIAEELRRKGKKIVHCHGCFDYIHFGHVKHFESAKKQGDILIVTVTPDNFIQKGPGRPFYSQDLRLEFLAAIEYIDYIALNKWETAVETINLIKPHVYVKGKEVLGNKDVDEVNDGTKKVSNLFAEEEILKSVGGKLYLTDEITFSSSNIINQITSAIPEESKVYLDEFRKKHSTSKILEIINSLKEIKVLIIGDAILDEYTFCQTMGISGKEPMISYKFLNSEIHPGGVFAVANHLAGFSENVNVVSCIGNNTYEFVESSLDKSIERSLFVQNNSKTIIKRKYLDNYRMNKLFSIYNVDELKISQETEEKILRYLDKNISRFDIILVSDFGHGMITPNILDYLSKTNKFLAINCQLNAGNLGYNFITKYKRADFISLNDREIRLPFQEKTGDVKVPILKLSKHLSLNNINITLGKEGIIYYKEGNFFYSPSFTRDPIDTIASGDAVFALTSILSYKNTDPEILPFLGNCIGGLATKIIGNRKPIDPIELRKFISYILK
ncbi:MAG: PfkB family carbohydrate kinase [Nanoarchaeota archaeon]